MNKRKAIKQTGTIRWRLFTVFSLIALVFFGLIVRTAYIQVISPDELKKQGDLRTHRQLSDTVLRGMITDRNGLELAISVPVNTVWADPKQVIESQGLDKDREWRALADILDIDVDKIKQRITANPTGRFVYLARQVSPAMADYVRHLNLKGVYLRPESKRYYPAAEINAHIVGITNIDDQGIDGIEKLYDDALTGENGKKSILRDAKGHVIEVLSEQAAKQAKDISLSIDQRIQTLAYQELKKAVQYYQADSGTVVALDVNSGEILAMVNNPSYNPNNRSGVSQSAMRNRSITDTFEPGSTIKPLAVLSALEFGSINAGSVIDTSPGWIMFGGRRVRDPYNRGKLTIEQILKKSSNVGTTKLALSLPHEQFLDAFYNVGFGSETGTGLLGESSGIFYDRRRWSEFELATLSFGYGLSVTALQLAQMYATIGNGGVRRPLSILKREAPMEGSQVFSHSSSRQLLKMMESVLDDDGSGHKAAVEGYRVAGKTGTSRKAVAGGYGNDYVGLFAGVAPVSDPKIALVVVINNPKGDKYYGGDVAAPVFSKVMGGALQILNVPNDKSDTDDIQLAQLKGDSSNAY
ncbi:penicillin-binding transpeptidase domain-containing protein [Catenovulum adriaticum]|uniref:Peptidoglycan D,D-transpeptidase FtsI n=1 Tax=Catenovulum adriaticum TaxID=2984846 RepID=A0ABY7AMV1_9ALTE|nr:penicillin-binding transpeptidase domain-containing protein [Catenovulum sp. TS8]WAJ69664.1 penicillin-binding transpeptidase domain-containing protein [Catenovulum sp. TS8]